MINNLYLKNTTAHTGILIISNDSNAFTKWLAAEFSKPKIASYEVITNITDKFDKLKHEGCLFRGDLVEWLYQNQGGNLLVE